MVGYDYPLLPPTALQQLILEYSPPVTYFSSEKRGSEPLLGIWSPEALGELRAKVLEGKNELSSIVKHVGGKAISPLRQEWINSTNTKVEWDELMEIVASRKKAW